jgi:hypothetical protein
MGASGPFSLVARPSAREEGPVRSYVLGLGLAGRRACERLGRDAEGECNHLSLPVTRGYFWRSGIVVFEARKLGYRVEDAVIEVLRLLVDRS